MKNKVKKQQRIDRLYREWALESHEFLKQWAKEFNRLRRKAQKIL